jgi:hypothetical protein
MKWASALPSGGGSCSGIALRKKVTLEAKNANPTSTRATITAHFMAISDANG